MYRFTPEQRNAYETMTVPFVVYQYVDGTVQPLLCSEGFCRQIGVPREKALSTLGSGLFERLHPDDVGMVARITGSFAKHESDYNVVFRSRRDDGYHYIHAVGHWMTMEDGTELAVLTYADITIAEQTIAQLNNDYHLFQQDRFYRDPLTGLPNINYLHEFAEERVSILRAEGKTPALFYSDVDSMQYYNNQYGFSKGDDLLRLIADLLRQEFPDALVARGADDHFIIVDVWNGEKEMASRLDAVNRRIRAEAFGKTTGIQLGVCVFDRHTRGFEAVDHARSALKRIGRDLNTTYRIYSQIADEHYWNERYIIQNLDRALEEGWIKVFYQGIARVETRKTACFEALARWNDPNRGTISPGEFIPILEKYHLLYKLDLYMVEQVCREVVLRSEAGLPLIPVSVNFSAQDFDYRDIPEEIEALYRRYEMEKYVPRNCFVVEITERDMATATGRFNEQLRSLRGKGYQLWLDDFGSGYSSLNVFSRFDIDLIKFDMDLIQDLDSRNGLNRKIISAMIQIAHGMGIHTLAEGVETPQQRDFLEDVGCELSQGFLYRRPESLNTILFKIANGSIRPSCDSSEEIQEFFRRGSDSPDA